MEVLLKTRTKFFLHPLMSEWHESGALHVLRCYL